jgi:methyl acetate hydrolase
MNSTGFKLTPDMRKRLVGMHARGADGSLTPVPFEMAQEPEFHMGGGGLYSTGGDYIRFIQMLLNDGALSGISMSRRCAPPFRRRRTTSIPGPIRTRNGA